jgi:membrane fusion protein (multidrug efflux system)
MKRKLAALACAVLVAGLASCHRKSNVITASGTVEVKEVDLVSRIQSRVVELYFDEGTAVKKGSILAKLDDRIVKAQRETSEAFFDQAQTNLERSKKLFASSSITREQFDQAKTQQIKAESDLKQARIMFDESNIYAPWDGTILKRNVEVGELVNVNTPVFTLGDMTTAKVTIYVPLPDLGRVLARLARHLLGRAFPDLVPISLYGERQTFNRAVRFAR